MSIIADLRKLKTGRAELRKFGLLVGGVFIAIGVVLLVRQKTTYPYFVGAGLLLSIFGAVCPRALKHVYTAWMAMAFTLGFVMSNVVLTLFFFLIVTPIGLVARLCGKDFLARKFDKRAASYWIPCVSETKTAESYERQF